MKKATASTTSGKGKVKATEPVPFSPTEDGEWLDMNGKKIEVGDMLITDSLYEAGDYFDCVGVVIDLCPNGNVAFHAIGGHVDAHPCRQVESFPVPKSYNTAGKWHGENPPAMPGMRCGIYLNGSGIYDAKILSASKHGAFVELLEDGELEDKAGTTHGVRWEQIHIWPAQYLD